MRRLLAVVLGALLTVAIGALGLWAMLRPPQLAVPPRQNLVFTDVTVVR
jgi:hypothetical protein